MKKHLQSNTFNRVGVLVLGLFLSVNVMAQNKQKWFRHELGLAQSAVYDDGHSLKKYKGTGMQLRLGNDKETAKVGTEFNTAFIWTPLSTTGSSAQQGNVRLSYTYLRKLAKTQDNKLKIAVGGSVSTDFNARFYSALDNNSVSWDVNLGLNIVGRVQRDFKVKSHSFSASYALELPVLTYNHRPNYLGYFPLGLAFDGKEGTSADFASLGRGVVGVNGNYFYLNQHVSLDKLMTNGNRLRLAYNWSYANNGFATHKYQNILSGFSFGLLTNLSKKQ
jgi:hypothetical protein